MNCDAETPSENDLSFWNIRHLQFRVLILGHEAEVRRNGKILPGQTVKGQIDRGLHNIDDEIRFRSRPGFVFHDSRGVEAGSATELSTVQRFVDERSSAATKVRKQVHAIWMCLPLDDCRELFLSERDIFRLLKGTAPLVVIFTKHDGAVSKETSQILISLS
ncbi:GTP-binding protein [Mycena venus]|uniref:GTP-binding protein n=1 Tax=Mycena venus TaxID=2733690 RepID=A0A8H7DFU2_9AGAR|nr:GTP-binding protein [Mycena venus]